MGCTDSAGESRWYLPRCTTEGCNWEVNNKGDVCLTCQYKQQKQRD